MQQALAVDPNAIQQINFTANLDLILEEARTCRLSQGTVKVVKNVNMS